MIKNIFNNKITQFLIVLIILLFFLRIDYRFETTVKCCSDEYDYYSHAATIVDDFPEPAEAITKLLLESFNTASNCSSVRS